MWENAEKFGALLIFVESRFYGASRPWFGPPPPGKGWSPVSYAPWQLRYLSVEQVLADHAAVSAWLRGGEKNGGVPGAQDSAVIAFGGSLGPSSSSSPSRHPAMNSSNKHSFHLFSF